MHLYFDEIKQILEEEGDQIALRDQDEGGYLPRIWRGQDKEVRLQRNGCGGWHVTVNGVPVWNTEDGYKYGAGYEAYVQHCK